MKTATKAAGRHRAPDPPPAGVGLKEYLEALLSEKDKRDQQRFDAQGQALAAALMAQEKAVSAALSAAEKAVTKAETAAEKRFDSQNEFRAQLADQAGTFMPRGEAAATYAALTERINTLKEIIDKGAGRGVGLQSGWGYLLGAAGFVATVLAIVGVR